MAEEGKRASRNSGIMADSIRIWINHIYFPDKRKYYLSVAFERGHFALWMLLHVPIGFVCQIHVHHFDPAITTLIFLISPKIVDPDFDDS